MAATKVIRHVAYMFGLSMFIVMASSTGHGKDRVRSFLVEDFADFHNIHQVCVINDVKRHVAFDEGNERIITETRLASLVLMLGSSKYLSVIPFEPSSGQTDVGNGRNISSVSESKNKLNADCPGLIVIQLLSSRDVFVFEQLVKDDKPKANWLLLSDEKFFDLLIHVNLILSSKVTIAVMTTGEEEGVVHLWEAYRVAPHLPLRRSRVGVWFYKGHQPDTQSLPSNILKPMGQQKTPSQSSLKMERKVMKYGVMIFAVGDIFDRRKDLTGLNLRCTAIHEAPATILTDTADGKVHVSGVLGIVIGILQEFTNFTTSCHRVRDGKWGYLENGRWMGMIGELLDNTADIAVAALDITNIRLTVVDFLSSIKQVRTVVFMKRPSSSDYMWTAYTKQFRPQAWLVLGFVLILTVLLMYLCAYLSPAQPSLSFIEATHMIIGLFFGQGSQVTMVSTSIRIVVFISLLLHVLLLTHYTTDLVSSLAGGVALPSINSLDAIAEDSSLSIGFVRDTSVQELLKESSIAEHQKIWKKVQDNNLADLTPSLEEGMKKVLEGNYLFMIADVPFYYSYGTDCRVFTLPVRSFGTDMSFAMRKGSPYVPIFNKVLLDIRSTGVLGKWWRHWTSRIRECDAVELKSVDMRAFMMSLVILAGFFIIALVILAVECLKIKQRPDKKKLKALPHEPPLVVRLSCRSK